MKSTHTALVTVWRPVSPQAHDSSIVLHAPVLRNRRLRMGSKRSDTALCPVLRGPFIGQNGRQRTTVLSGVALLSNYRDAIGSSSYLTTPSEHQGPINVLSDNRTTFDPTAAVLIPSSILVRLSMPVGAALLLFSRLVSQDLSTGLKINIESPDGSCENAGFRPHGCHFSEYTKGRRVRRADAL